MEKNRYNYDPMYIYEYVENRKQEGFSTKIAMGEIIEKFNLPDYIVRNALYSARRKVMVDKILPPITPITIEPPKQDINIISDMVQSGDKIGLNTTTILKELLSLLEDVAENEKLRKNLANEREKVARLENEMNNIRTHVNSLNQLLEHFMSLTSLEKVSTLSDFTYQLKVKLDKHDNVIQIDRLG